MHKAATPVSSESIGTVPMPSAGSLQTANGASAWFGPELLRQALEYWVDAWQRSILFLDVLRRRGNDHFEHIGRKAPNVLGFGFELVLDARRFDRPINYCLVRIVPGPGTQIDPKKRPFIIFDPRACHSPIPTHRKHYLVEDSEPLH